MSTTKKTILYKEPSIDEKIAFMREKTAELVKSPKKARAFLESAGIIKPEKKVGRKTKKT